MSGQVHFASGAAAGTGEANARAHWIPYRSAQLLTLGFPPHPDQPGLANDRSEDAIAAAAERGLQRLLDAIVWIDPDEDLGPYIGDQGFRLPDPGEDEE